MTQTQGTLHMSPINPAVTYHIPLQIYGYTCSFLVDTGAAVTLISTLTWTCCKLSGQYAADLIPWNQQCLVGIVGSQLQVKEYVSVQLNFGGHNFVTSVIVVKGLTEEAILGLEFLQQHQCIIDCGQHMLQLSGRNLAIPLGFAMQTITISTPATAVLKETTIVPAHLELETLAVVPDFVNHAGTWLIEISCLVRKWTQASSLQEQ